PGRGHGSTFTITLPAGSASALKAVSAPSNPKAPDIRGARLLLIEDDESTRATIGEILSLAGAQVYAAEDSGTGMEQLRNMRPDILVCDIALPGENGLDFLSKVRRRPANEGGATPALALTAFASEEDRARTRAAGFQRHLVKPVDIEQLIGAVAELLHRDTPA
ncbi:MAG TPA: response regulator, partial [Polyangiaceae bacterium]